MSTLSALAGTVSRKRAALATGPPAFVWYARRHTKATDLLENGASTGTVVSLLGHHDPSVVLKFYGRHIEKRREHQRGLVERLHNLY